MNLFRSESFRTRWNVAFLSSWLMLASAQAGCRTAAPMEIPAANPSGALWNAAAILEHLRVLSSAETAGQDTGTEASALAADYVADQMRQFELQPAFQSGYQVTYPVGMSVMGFLAGKHPVFSRGLVIVCADLDVSDPDGGVGGTNPADVGTATAALLEVARIQAEAAQVFASPQRTILFASWPNGQAHAGFRAYLNQPLWPLDATRAVIYLGLRQDEARRLRTLLAPRGITLYTAAPPDSLRPRSTAPAPDTPAPSGQTAPGVTPRSQELDRASLAAGRMTEEVNRLLVSTALSTVAVPSSQASPKDAPTIQPESPPAGGR